MNASKLFCSKSLLGLLFLLVFISCSAHIENNRETVWPIRVQREVSTGGIIIKTKTSDKEQSVLEYITNNFKSWDGNYSLGINFHYNERTKIITGSASGVALTHDGLILTNHHVTRTNPKRIEIVLRQGKNEVSHRAQLVAFTEFGSEGNDLAVIKVNARFSKVARFGESRQIYESANVYNWGFPFGLSENAIGRSYNFGHISKTRINIPFFGNQERFLMGIKGIGGVSGSGIYARDGRLIGIMQGHIGYGLYMVGIPVNQIRRFLDEHRIPYSG